MDNNREKIDRSEYPRILSWALTYLHRKKMKYMNDSLKEYGIFGAMYMILNHVSRHPGTSQDAIVNHLNIDKCTVARRTKKLEELGYLYRTTDKNDRRQNNLHLTDRGTEIIPVIREHLRKWGEDVSISLTDEEKDTLLSLMKKVVDARMEQDR